MDDFQFVKSGTGYDLHYLKTVQLDENHYDVEWYCWYFSKEFLESLENHGLPPACTDYNGLMFKFEREGKIAKDKKLRL